MILLDNACMVVLLPFVVNRAIIMVFFDNIASARDLTNYW